MVVVLIITVGTKAAFLIVSGMAGDAVMGGNAFAGSGDLFDLGAGGILLVDNVRRDGARGV
jgi:hypothetical protein